MAKDTDQLNNILKNTHTSDIQDYFEANADSMLSDDRPFADYMRELIKTKGIKQQDVFLEADIPERYGYKLIAEEKRTRQRDIILRICYAARLTPEETDGALKRYGMPTLYAKDKRDAILIVLFNERPGDILKVNSILKENGVDTLKSCGVQD